MSLLNQNQIDKMFKIKRGLPLPYGSSITKDGINFSIFSKNCSKVTLLLFLSGENEPIAEVVLDENINKTGDVWHILISGIEHSKIRYGYKLEKIPNPNPSIYRYSSDMVLIDPYAKALSGGEKWGEKYIRDGDVEYDINFNHRRSVVYEDSFDWEDDRPLKIPFSETIIYELHARGYTKDDSSNVVDRGTFLGLCEKIEYLKELGITAVELLPIYEFEEQDSNRVNPITKQKLLNFWGYHPINFFYPKSSYSKNPHSSGSILEFKEMVKRFHKAGIEVILDVVFNHTSEGNEDGYTHSFRGIDNPIYYILEENGKYANYSGCGNTLNCNNPIVRDLILQSLRYWVVEMHVDGFRFDLASILGRGQNGEVLANPPLLERIAHDPILANTKLIAEAWDAAGLYQVGSFPSWGRWAEWNGKYRDDVRRFVKSDSGMVGEIKNRLLGSPDIYSKSGRSPYHSINFITCHDGFTMMDLVSYNQKHNIENGEENRDGTNDNHSWNCGVEGESKSKDILAFRKKQIKNFATILFLSDGVPMILGGDEFLRTQGGNNNAYCQDNKISWVDWNLLRKNRDIFRFFKLLIEFRKSHPLLKAKNLNSYVKENIELKFLTPELLEDVHSFESRTVAMYIKDINKNIDRVKSDNFSHLYLIMNFYWEDLEFKLPPLDCCANWRRFIDTSLDAPKDFTEGGSLYKESSYIVKSRSIVMFLGDCV